MQIRHNTLTSESGSSPPIGATQWDEAHEVVGLYNRRSAMGVVSNGSSLLTFGNITNTATVSTTGTASVFGGSGTSFQTRYASAATANATASVSFGAPMYIPPLNAYRSAGLAFSAYLDFFDASYGSGATGARMVFGLTRVIGNILDSDDGTPASNSGQGIWFSYSTNRGGNWRIVIRKDSTSTTLIDTGVAFSPGVWSLELIFNEATASFDWSIRQIGGTGATGSYTEVGGNFPSNRATTYVCAAGLSTLTTTARNFGVISINVDRLEPA